MNKCRRRDLECEYWKVEIGSKYPDWLRPKAGEFSCVVDSDVFEFAPDWSTALISVAALTAGEGESETLAVVKEGSYVIKSEKDTIHVIDPEDFDKLYEVV